MSLFVSLDKSAKKNMRLIHPTFMLPFPHHPHKKKKQLHHKIAGLLGTITHPLFPRYLWSRVFFSSLTPFEGGGNIVSSFPWIGEFVDSFG